METYVTPLLLGVAAHLMVGLICWVAGLLSKFRYIVVVAVVLGTFTVMSASVEKMEKRHEDNKDWLGNTVLPDPILRAVEGAGTMPGVATVEGQEVEVGPSAVGGGEAGFAGGGGASW